MELINIPNAITGATVWDGKTMEDNPRVWRKEFLIKEFFAIINFCFLIAIPICFLPLDSNCINNLNLNQ